MPSSRDSFVRAFFPGEIELPEEKRSRGKLCTPQTVASSDGIQGARDAHNGSRMVMATTLMLDANKLVCGSIGFEYRSLRLRCKAL